MKRVCGIFSAALCVGVTTIALATGAASPADKYCKFIFDDPPPDCTFVERDVAQEAVSIPALHFRFVSFKGSWTARGTARGIYPNDPGKNWQYSFTTRSPQVVLRPVKRSRGIIQLATSTTDPRYYQKASSRRAPPPLTGWVAGTVVREEDWANLPDTGGEQHTGSCEDSVRHDRTAGVGYPEFVLLRRGRVKVEVTFGPPGKQCVTRRVRFTSAGEPPSGAYSFWLFRTIPVRSLQRSRAVLRWAGTRHETYTYSASDHDVEYSWNWQYAVTLVLRKA